MTNNSQVPKMKKSAVIIRLLKHLLRYKGYLILAGALTVMANLLALIGPELSGRAIDSINGKGSVDFDTVFQMVLLMLIFYLISAILSFLLSLVMINLSRRVVYSMRKEVFEHLLDLPVKYFDSNKTGDLISRLSYDIDTINTSLSNDLIQISSGLITIIGCCIMMARISPMLMLVFLVTVPILIVFTNYRVRKVKPLFRTRSSALGELNGYAEEMLSGQKTIKAYGKEQVMIDRFDLHNSFASEAYYRADYEGSVIGPSVNFINNLTLSLISMFGALLLMLSSSPSMEVSLLTLIPLSLGSLSSFILYSRRFSGPINETANIISEIQSATSAAERIFRLLDESPEPYLDSSDSLDDSKDAEISIENIDFSYVEGVKVLKNINIRVKSGSTVAIVGPTGSGKTSLVNLLMRFYDPQSGEILINSQNTRSHSLESVRDKFTMVLQDTWLFGASIAENISYGSENISLDDIIEASKTVGIHSFISSLPEGYNTVITDEGASISKGQKQLITIARALLMNRPILILDEATSNVDSRTEAALQRAMKEIMKGRTSIVIAHRLSTIKDADVIIVLKGGEIIEAGSHTELLSSGGFYASLYNSQFESSV